jgi:replicative DNA helicase
MARYLGGRNLKDVMIKYLQQWREERTRLPRQKEEQKQSGQLRVDPEV